MKKIFCILILLIKIIILLDSTFPKQNQEVDKQVQELKKIAETGTLRLIEYYGLHAQIKEQYITPYLKKNDKKVEEYLKERKQTLKDEYCYEKYNIEHELYQYPVNLDENQKKEAKANCEQIKIDKSKINFTQKGEAIDDKKIKEADQNFLPYKLFIYFKVKNLHDLKEKKKLIDQLPLSKQEMLQFVFNMLKNKAYLFYFSLIQQIKDEKEQDILKANQLKLITLISYFLLIRGHDDFINLIQRKSKSEYFKPFFNQAYSSQQVGSKVSQIFKLEQEIELSLSKEQDPDKKKQWQNDYDIFMENYGINILKGAQPIELIDLYTYFNIDEKVLSTIYFLWDKPKLVSKFKTLIQTCLKAFLTFYTDYAKVYDKDYIEKINQIKNQTAIEQKNDNIENAQNIIKEEKIIQKEIPKPNEEPIKLEIKESSNEVLNSKSNDQQQQTQQFQENKGKNEIIQTEFKKSEKEALKLLEYYGLHSQIRKIYVDPLNKNYDNKVESYLKDRKQLFKEDFCYQKYNIEHKLYQFQINLNEIQKKEAKANCEKINIDKSKVSFTQNDNLESDTDQQYDARIELADQNFLPYKLFIYYKVKNLYNLKQNKKILPFLPLSEEEMLSFVLKMFKNQTYLFDFSLAQTQIGEIEKQYLDTIGFVSYLNIFFGYLDFTDQISGKGKEFVYNPLFGKFDPKESEIDLVVKIFKFEQEVELSISQFDTPQDTDYYYAVQDYQLLINNNRWKTCNKVNEQIGTEIINNENNCQEILANIYFLFEYFEKLRGDQLQDETIGLYQALKEDFLDQYFSNYKNYIEEKMNEIKQMEPEKNESDQAQDNTIAIQQKEEKKEESNPIEIIAQKQKTNEINPDKIIETSQNKETINEETLNKKNEPSLTIVLTQQQNSIESQQNSLQEKYETKINQNERSLLKLLEYYGLHAQIKDQYIMSYLKKYDKKVEEYLKERKQTFKDDYCYEKYNIEHELYQYPVNLDEKQKKEAKTNCEQINIDKSKINFTQKAEAIDDKKIKEADQNFLPYKLFIYYKVKNLHDMKNKKKLINLLLSEQEMISFVFNMLKNKAYLFDFSIEQQQVEEYLNNTENNGENKIKKKQMDKNDLFINEIGLLSYFLIYIDSPRLYNNISDKGIKDYYNQFFKEKNWQEPMADKVAKIFKLEQEIELKLARDEKKDKNGYLLNDYKLIISKPEIYLSYTTDHSFIELLNNYKGIKQQDLEKIYYLWESYSHYATEEYTKQTNIKYQELENNYMKCFKTLFNSVMKERKYEMIAMQTEKKEHNSLFGKAKTVQFTDSKINQQNIKGDEQNNKVADSQDSKIIQSITNNIQTINPSNDILVGGGGSSQQAYKPDDIIKKENIVKTQVTPNIDKVEQFKQASQSVISPEPKIKENPLEIKPLKQQESSEKNEKYEKPIKEKEPTKKAEAITIKNNEDKSITPKTKEKEKEEEKPKNTIRKNPNALLKSETPKKEETKGQKKQEPSTKKASVPKPNHEKNELTQNSGSTSSPKKETKAEDNKSSNPSNNKGLNEKKEKDKKEKEDKKGKNLKEPNKPKVKEKKDPKPTTKIGSSNNNHKSSDNTNKGSSSDDKGKASKKTSTGSKSKKAKKEPKTKLLMI